PPSAPPSAPRRAKPGDTQQGFAAVPADAGPRTVDASMPAGGRGATDQRIVRQLKEGIDVDDAHGVIETLRRSEDPVITVPIEFLNSVATDGILARPTWTGDKIIAGTIGLPPYKGTGDQQRFIVRVINKDVGLMPRPTGPDQQFHGVVMFSKTPLKLGRDIVIELPDGT